MKQPSLLLKIVALGSSLLLASGYICLRAGVFNSALASSPGALPADAFSSPLTLMHDSKAIDTPGLSPDLLCTPPEIPAVIDQLPSK
jgi:hypothetical protein